MRKVFITDNIDNIARQYSEEILSNNLYGKVRINPIKKLDRLSQKLRTLSVYEVVCVKRNKKRCKAFRENQTYADYVDLIKCKISEELITLKPSAFPALINEFNDPQYKVVNLDIILQIGNRKPCTFYELICTALQYTEIRQYILPKYIRRTGIKTCCYCNANYAITDSNGVAYYDIDHWKPRSVFPYLAISFFNLQPSCHNCNMHKSDDIQEEYMSLWEDNVAVSLDICRFKLGDEFIQEFWQSNKIEDFYVRIEPIGSENMPYVKGLREKLYVETIYQEFSDVIALTLWRKKIYNQAMKESIENSIGISFSQDEMEHLIYGVDMRREDILKRPLNKLIQDVVDEVDELIR